MARLVGGRWGLRRRRLRRCLRRCRGRGLLRIEQCCGGRHRFRGLEAEIAFLIGQDLPPREKAYSRDEVVAAIASCHPAIEVIESGLLDPMKAAKLSMIADLQMHGGFVYGAGGADWQRIDFSKEHVTLAVDGVVRVERTGSNTSGDLMRLLPWLANEGAARTGGLRRVSG